MGTEMLRRWIQESTSSFPIDEEARFEKIRAFLRTGPKQIHQVAGYLGCTVGTAMALLDSMLARHMAEETPNGSYTTAKS